MLSVHNVCFSSNWSINKMFNIDQSMLLLVSIKRGVDISIAFVRVT